MADPRLLYFVSFRDNDGSYKTPWIGSNGFRDASGVPTFAAAAYNGYNTARIQAPSNGIYSDTTTVEIPPEGCVECWVRLDGWSWSGTTVSNGVDKTVFGWRAANATPFLQLAFANGNGLQFYLTTGTPRIVNVTSQSFSDGEDVHLAISWKEDGANGLMKVYVNGAEVGSGTFDLGLTGSNQNGPNFGGLPTRDDRSIEGYLFNGKVWNYFKTDFSDRERPRAGLNDFGA